MAEARSRYECGRLRSVSREMPRKGSGQVPEGKKAKLVDIYTIVGCVRGCRVAPLHVAVRRCELLANQCSIN